MKKRTAENTAVIVAAISAVITAIYTNTNWLSAKVSEAPMRERCYGVVSIAKNDCATSKHSCASQAVADRSPDEFIMLPKGLCKRIVGGKVG